jgi:hypothetical protein
MEKNAVRGPRLRHPARAPVWLESLGRRSRSECLRPKAGEWLESEASNAGRRQRRLRRR